VITSPKHRGAARSNGQSVAEFALILPVMLLLALAIGDFGRVYASLISTEASAREAADYGAFSPGNWDSANLATTESEMTRRACTAVRHLPDYVGAVDGSTCTNPTVVWSLEHASGPATPNACSKSNVVPPCVVHVTATFEFRTLIRFPPLPESVVIVRDSYYAITELPDPDASPSPEATLELPTPNPTVTASPPP
jgi:Flp pilus assembly protein TadG